MVYKPLSDARSPHLGATKPLNTSEPNSEVDDLPVGVFFAANRQGDPADCLHGLYYKDGVGAIRRVGYTKTDRFAFLPVKDAADMLRVGTVLFVPEVDPRAWVAAPEVASHRPPELSTIARGGFFTALGVTEHPSSQRFGVYRVGRDGMVRRLLKDSIKGLNWSEAIPFDRFSHFGQQLEVPEA